MILDGLTDQVTLTLNDLTLYGISLIKWSYFDHYIAENAPNIFFALCFIIPRNNIFYNTGIRFFYYYSSFRVQLAGNQSAAIFPEIGVTHLKIDTISVFYDFFASSRLVCHTVVFFLGYLYCYCWYATN